MTSSLLEAPAQTVEGLLEVEREGISFHNVAADRVAIEIVVSNRGEHHSGPAQARIMAAPLGAFVPWQPLTAVHVPALEPGASYHIRTEAVRVRPALLGEPDRVRPEHVLSTFGSGDRRGPGSPGAWLLGHLLSQHPRHVRPRVEAVAAGPGDLPSDLFELIGRTNPHWAGNLNVFVAGRAVERHLAQALRVYPGRTNLAMFIVGSGCDAYAFRLAGDGSTWDTMLFDATDGQSLALAFRNSRPVDPGRWLQVTSRRLMILAMRPPQACRRGTIEVHVDQQSTARTAVVEFSLDPAAAGPGCYVV